MNATTFPLLAHPTLVVLLALASLPTTLIAQQAVPHAGNHQHAQHQTSTTGPHKGPLKAVGNLQAETLVTPAGLKVYLYDLGGQPVSVQQSRGVARLSVEGNAKRYRYDLFPSEDNALKADVDLSRVVGRQLTVDVQLVGAAPDTLAYQDVTVLSPAQSELDAVAITRQKVCVVSGKPLGSMGNPVAVQVAGQRLFVCCAGCVDALKANPEKFTQARPKVEVVKFTESDAALITKQAVCPVMDEPLGGMGQPIKLLVGGKPLFLCCKGCIKKVQSEPEKYLAMVYRDGEKGSERVRGNVVPAGTDAVRPDVFKVSDADKPFIAAQKKCPVMDEPLDAMGGPYKVNADGKAIYICCPGCAKKIAAEPQKYLAVLKSQGVDAPAIR
ncbi:hypothetical protein RISK_005406 [Rhodopirellula islandica]|uniref:Archaeal TRASH domain protein n=1 Tax=Rhodopirellula islandica TaxID=595434 RepID=A0A0J1B698_RHOIS|nr:hypothetical protein [Rhodopirellula islandica]KLU02340.1 hypothetical protein RISK_005406 [Rhodopirellula islandica]